MYKVNASEEFFNRFKELSLELEELSYLFQNPNAESNYEEICNWNERYKSLVAKIKDHHIECIYRIYTI